MANYEEVRVKLTSNQLNSCLQQQNKAVTTLRIAKKSLKMMIYHKNYFQQQDKKLK